MGFRDFQEFNTTLLTKQFWRLINKPKSLVSRVYKGSFLGRHIIWINTDHTHHHLVEKVYVLLNLWLKKLIIREGIGKSISMWNNPWISIPEISNIKTSISIFTPLIKGGTSH